MTIQEAKTILEKNWWKFNNHLHSTYQDYSITIGEIVEEDDDYERFIISATISKGGEKDEQLSGNYVVYKNTGVCRPAIFFDKTG